MEFRFHHVGLAVRSLNEAAAALTAVGLRPDPAFPDAVDHAMRVKLRFLRGGADQPLVELVEGLEPGSPVENILARSGPTPYHLCFEVPSIADAGAELRRAGYRPTGPRIAAIAFDGRTIQFFYQAHCGLMELLEAA